MNEQDTRKQLLNGICGSKSEITPEIASQDGVLNISDVQDTREKLEADVRQYANPGDYKNTLGSYWEKKILSFLDRQAAITERMASELHEKFCALCKQGTEGRIAELTEEREQYRDNMLAQTRRVAELTAERDELRETINGIEHGQEMLDLRSHIHERDKQIAELTAERDELQEAVDAMGNGQFYAMYLKACEERDYFKDLVQESAERTCVPHGEWERMSQTQEFRRMYCDCGYELGLDRHETLPYEHTLYFPMPYFCPECGARILSKANAVTDE